MIFSQRDRRWAKNRLGYSRLTIGGYGCLITSYAMVLRFYGRKTDPAMINRLLTKNGGYTSGGALYWNVLPNIYDYDQKLVDVRNRPVTRDELDELKRYVKDRPAIIQVDMNPNTARQDMHFAVVYGYENGQFLIADPWTGDTATLQRYFGAANTSESKAIYRIVYFSPKDWTPPTDDCKKYKDKYHKERDLRRKLEKENEKCGKKVAELERKVGEVNARNAELEQEVKRLEHVIDKVRELVR